MRGTLFLKRVVDIAEEHAMPLEVLAEVISNVFDRNLGDLSKDELIKLGTDIKAGVYDVPTEPPVGERDGQVGLATPAATLQADIDAAGQDERDAARGPDPLAEQRDASPATTPRPATLDDILQVTGGEVIEPEASASVERREVGALRASGQPSRPTKDAAEAVVKARARAEAAR